MTTPTAGSLVAPAASLDQTKHAAPPSPGGAVAEQERLVALIPVLSRDPFLSNLLRRSLADRDSLGLSLEGCEPLGPLARKLCTFVIPGVGRSMRSPCHSRPCSATACRPPRFQPSSWSCGIISTTMAANSLSVQRRATGMCKCIVSCPFQSAVDGLPASTAVRKSGTIEACPSVSACFQELFAGCVRKATFSGTSILLTIV